MMKRDQLLKSLRKTIWGLAVGILFSGVASGDTHNLFLTDGGFDISSGGTIERFVEGITNFPGRVRLKAVFHVDSGFNEFARLQIELRRGAQSVFSSSCYSIHAPSDKTPKCDFTINITQAVAGISAPYTLKVTNNSGKSIKEFNVKKVGLNFLVPDFKSTFTEDCPSTINLIMEGSPFTLVKGASLTRNLSGIGRNPGLIILKAKWHTATLIPNVFVKLRVELLRPDGSVAKGGDFYSNHAPYELTPSFLVGTSYHVTDADTRMSGNWRIRVTNNSKEKIEGFDVRKGSDGNPFVHDFNSTYKAVCN